MKRVLVTGASGFIGHFTLAPLVARGYEVHALRTRAGALMPPKVTWHDCDLFDDAALSHVMESVKPTHLLHLAWYVKPGGYENHEDNAVWVSRSLELVRHFRRNGGQRVVTAGTSYEYDWSYGYCSEDVTPIGPTTFYGTCKHALNEMISGYCAQTGMTSAWGRVFFLYGPREYPQRLVSSVIRALLEGKDAPCSHGLQVRDYMSVEDIADAFVALLDSNVDGNCNIASGEPVTLKTVVTRIGELMQRPDLIKLGVYPPRPNDVPLVVADTRKLNTAVGWKPRFSLDEGLRRTIDWWGENMGVVKG